jgi:hypothetical protein
MVDVETGIGQDQAGRVLLRLLLRGHDDGVAADVEAVAVLLAEGGGIGEGGIDRDDLVGDAEPVEDPAYRRVGA